MMKNRAFPAAVAVSFVVMLPAAVMPVAAGEKNRAVTQRQLAQCMTKRMMADRAESYHDARRLCNHELALRAAAPETALNRANPAVLPKN